MTENEIVKSLYAVRISMRDGYWYVVADYSGDATMYSKPHHATYEDKNDPKLINNFTFAKSMTFSAEIVRVNYHKPGSGFSVVPLG